MSTVIKNNKGLCASISENPIIKEDMLLKLNSFIQNNKIKDKNLTDLILLLNQLPGEKHFKSKIFPALPLSWINESFEIQLTPIEAKNQNLLALEISKKWHQVLPLILSATIDGTANSSKIIDFFQIDRWGNKNKIFEMPKPDSNIFKNLDTYQYIPAGPEFYLQQADGFAIWMDDKSGWMDFKKNSSPYCSGARLFESAAAAARTAKAAKFGDAKERGPALIVKINVDPFDIIDSNVIQGHSLGFITSIIAQREADILEQTISNFTFESNDSIIKIPDGAFEGVAIWLEDNYYNTNSAGFKNQRGLTGPISGAQLHKDLQEAKRSAGYYSNATAFVRVFARPVEIIESIGNADKTPVENLILAGQKTINDCFIEKQKEIKVTKRKRL